MSDMNAYQEATKSPRFIHRSALISRPRAHIRSGEVGEAEEAHP